jgi:plastocyanin
MRPNVSTGARRQRPQVNVLVTEQDYEPAEVTVRAGTPARITFVRTTEKTCGTEVVLQSLNIERAVPLNQPATIEFTPSVTGEIRFVCGMKLLRGSVVVDPGGSARRTLSFSLPPTRLHPAHPHRLVVWMRLFGRRRVGLIALIGSGALAFGLLSAAYRRSTHVLPADCDQ